MTVAQLLQKKSVTKIGKIPVVVIPLHIWNEMEEIVEDWEMMTSKTLQKRIAASSKSKKLYSSTAVKKILGL